MVILAEALRGTGRWAISAPDRAARGRATASRRPSSSTERVAGGGVSGTRFLFDADGSIRRELADGATLPDGLAERIDAC